MWQALFAMGYKGGYGCVCTVARAWKIAEGLVALGAAFIPLKDRHCEDFQFDWSTEYIFDTLELIWPTFKRATRPVTPANTTLAFVIPAAAHPDSLGFSQVGHGAGRFGARC